MALASVPLLVAASVARSDDEFVTPACHTTTSHDSCNRWYSAGAVSLEWKYGPQPVKSISGCEPAVFTTESRVERKCTVMWDDGTQLAKPIWIGIDRTPPQVLAPQLSRAADRSSWFNRPVSMSFQGSDKTSGVASCSSATYGGPDGAGMSISGSCRDVAGNVGSGSFSLNYDATPPARPKLTATPGNKRARLGWSSSEPAQADVVRFQRGRAPALAYSGGADTFTDRKLRNERRYRYLVVLTDRAGNRSQNEVRVVPTASKLLSPARDSRVRRPPFLVWKRARHASYYNVQLIKARKVLSRWPRTSSLQLKKRWRYGGRRLRLAPGRYRWYVWPGYGRRSAHRYGHLLGKSTFTVVR